MFRDRKLEARARRAIEKEMSEEGTKCLILNLVPNMHINIQLI